MNKNELINVFLSNMRILLRALEMHDLCTGRFKTCARICLIFSTEKCDLIIRHDTDTVTGRAVIIYVSIVPLEEFFGLAGIQINSLDTVSIDRITFPVSSGNDIIDRPCIGMLLMLQTDFSKKSAWRQHFSRAVWHPAVSFAIRKAGLGNVTRTANCSVPMMIMRFR